MEEESVRTIRFRGRNLNTGALYSSAELGSDQLTISADGRGFVNVNSTSVMLSEFYPHIQPEQFTGVYAADRMAVYECDVMDFGGGRWIVEWSDAQAAWLLVKLPRSDAQQFALAALAQDELVRSADQVTGR
jgi:hypothetical protein